MNPAPVPEGFRRPKHGNGLLRPLFAKGNIPKHSTRPSRYIETLQIARRASPDAMNTLIERMKDPDGRIAVVAANSILERAWGKAREQKPEEQEKATIDLSSLKGEELALLVRLVESGRLRSTVADVDPEPPPADVDGEVVETGPTDDVR